MVKVEFTNIIIDDFNLARKEPHVKHIHILTHIHSDHLKGLSDSWSFGAIYCSPITKQLLLTRYPSLNCVTALPLDIQHTLQVSPTLNVALTFFDANHCAGAVMVLLEGYMGTVLHTGDMRFSEEVFRKHTYLYPYIRRNSQFDKCSKHIDVLFFDNTFLKKKFSFPSQREALLLTEKFVRGVVEEKKFKRIYMGMDNYGKEEVLVHLARNFDTFIVVDEMRYETLKAMEVDLELFTTNAEQGFIQVISKKSIVQQIRKEPNTVGMILTGWANQAHYRIENLLYCIPYSLHSNYQEIQAFVKSVRPSIMHPIVNDSADQQISDEDMYEPLSYREQIQYLREKYCSPMSAEYGQLLNDFQLQKLIMERMQAGDKTAPSINKNVMAPAEMQFGPRKRYKLANKRNEQQIQQFKNKLQTIKDKVQMEEALEIEEISESCEVQDPPTKKRHLNEEAPSEEDIKEIDKGEYIERPANRAIKSAIKPAVEVLDVDQVGTQPKVVVVQRNELDVYSYLNSNGSKEARGLKLLSEAEELSALLGTDRSELREVLQKLIKEH